MKDGHVFCREFFLSLCRSIPQDEVSPGTKLSVVGTGFRDEYLVEGDNDFAEEVEASCKWYAKGLFLSHWLHDSASHREAQTDQRIAEMLGFA